MILKKEKIIYVHINKTAGSSIEIAFDNQQPPKQHLAFRHYCEKYDTKKYFTFSFVRNPWDRMVSWHLWLNRQKFWYDGMPKFDGMVGIPEKGVNFGGHPSVNESWYLPLKKDFKTFLKKIETSKNVNISKKDNLSEENYHEGRWVASQTEWLKNTRGRVSLDFIGRFENLQEDFDSICDKIGKKKIKLLEAKKLNKRPHYSSFYDDESISIIERLYKDDIKRFNYEYEEAPVQSLR